MIGPRPSAARWGSRRARGHIDRAKFRHLGPNGPILLGAYFRRELSAEPQDIADIPEQRPGGGGAQGFGGGGGRSRHDPLRGLFEFGNALSLRTSRAAAVSPRRICRKWRSPSGLVAVG